MVTRISFAKAVPTVQDATEAMQDKYFLASGCYRKVYRVPGSPWVYKNDFNGRTNKLEFEVYQQFLPSLPEDIHFPEMHLLENNVLAAEYVEGDIGDDNCWDFGSITGCANKLCTQNCWARRIQFLSEQIRDLHYQNIRILPSGHIYIIDLGGGFRRG